MKLVSLTGYPRLGRRDDAVEGSCPNGGSWYSCDKAVHRFVGCCTRDPCSTAAGCAAGDLREAGMGDMPHGVYPDQSCPSFGAQFWTCKPPGGSFSFWGCCKINPCANQGCSGGNLGGAALNSGPNPFVEEPVEEPTTLEPTPTPTPIPTPTPTATRITPKLSPTEDSTTSSSSSSSTSTSESNPQVSEIPKQSNGPSTAIIAGCAVGGFLLALLCVALVWWIRRRKKRDAQELMLPPMAFAPPPPPGAKSNRYFDQPANPEASDSYYYASGAAGAKSNQAPPSAYHSRSPSLPAYPGKRMSYELAGGEVTKTNARPVPSPIPGDGAWIHTPQTATFELVGSPQPAPIHSSSQFMSELLGDSEITRVHRGTGTGVGLGLAGAPSPHASTGADLYGNFGTDVGPREQEHGKQLRSP